jgi:hypothetical protein
LADPDAAALLVSEGFGSGGVEVGAESVLGPVDQSLVFGLVVVVGVEVGGD